MVETGYIPSKTSEVGNEDRIEKSVLMARQSSQLKGLAGKEREGKNMGKWKEPGKLGLKTYFLLSATSTQRTLGTKGNS